MIRGVVVVRKSKLLLSSSESGAKATAVQTLRATRVSLFVAKRLDCGVFTAALRSQNDEPPSRLRAAKDAPSPGGEGRGRSTSFPFRSSRRQEALTQFANGQWPLSLSLLTSAATGEVK
jgi:hypothetical protein